jgi:dipeptidase E
MKLYLSSFKVGNDTEGFKNLVNKAGAKVAVIDNSRDYSTDLERKANSLQGELDAMTELGFIPEHLDLRDYFGKPGALVEKLGKFDVVWVVGGNSFLLRKAMEQSGFSEVIDRLIKTNKLVYAGYSAGICVLAPSLKGVELVDDPNVQAEGYDADIIWEGYGLIDFYPIVHYDSDHPESHLVDVELEHIKSLGIKYRTLRDGDTIIIDTP